MARLTFFTSFFVLVLKASQTLKLIIVTHFQKFFRWPGAPKKDPKGRPNVILLVSFFVLGPNGVQGGPRRCPRKPKRGPGGPKRNPRHGKGNPKRVQGDPKGVQGEPRGTEKGSRKAAGNWIFLKSVFLFEMGQDRSRLAREWSQRASIHFWGTFTSTTQETSTDH